MKKLFKNRITLGIICMALAVVICFVVTPFYNKALSNIKKVVRVKEPISMGEMITVDKLEVVEVGGYNLPDKIATSIEQIEGTYAGKDLSAGDYITPEKASQNPIKGNEYLYMLDGSEIAVSFMVNTFSAGLSDKLIAGDIITLVGKDDKVTIMPVELTYVRVLAVTMKNGGDIVEGNKATDASDTNTASVTVVVTPLQARLIIALERQGLHSALVYRGSEYQKFLDMQKDTLIGIESGEIQGTVLKSEQDQGSSAGGDFIDMDYIDSMVAIDPTEN